MTPTEGQFPRQRPQRLFQRIEEPSAPFPIESVRIDWDRLIAKRPTVLETIDAMPAFISATMAALVWIAIRAWRRLVVSGGAGIMGPRAGWSRSQCAAGPRVLAGRRAAMSRTRWASVSSSSQGTASS